MKKKVIFSVIFCVLLALELFGTSARASLSDSLTYNEIDFTGTKQDALEKIWQLFNLEWDQSDSLSSSSQTNQYNMLAVLGNYDYMIVGHQISSTISNSYRIVDIILSSTNRVTGNSAMQYYQLVNHGPNDLIPVFGSLSTNPRGYSITIDSNKYDYVLKYNNGTWLEYSVNDSTIAADTFDFSPNYDAITNYNGYQQLYTKKYDYSINNWLMGELTPSEKYSKYELRLLDSNGNIILRDIYNQQYGTNTENSLFINTVDKKLYVKSMALNYKTIYTLVIYLLDNDGNITSNNFVGTFMYLPLNATISGDTILSVGSGDYNTQNSTNDIIDFFNDTSEAGNTFDNFLSGDADSFANTIGYSPLANPFVEIIRNTLTSIVNVFLGSGNQTLDISFYGRTITLNSNDFVLPDGPIKTFISLISNGFLLWAIVKYGFVLYQWINSGRLKNMVDEVTGHWYNVLF